VPKIANEVTVIPQGLGLDNVELVDVTELLKSHSQPVTNEEREDLVAQLSQKQQSKNKKSLFYSLQKPRTWRKFWPGLIDTCRG
jgi:hypothetical protein